MFPTINLLANLFPTEYVQIELYRSSKTHRSDGRCFGRVCLGRCGSRHRWGIDNQTRAGTGYSVCLISSSISRAAVCVSRERLIPLVESCGDGCRPGLVPILHESANMARKGDHRFMYTYSVRVVVASAWVMVAFAKVKVVVVRATSVTTTGSMTVPRNLLQYEDASGCRVWHSKARRHRLVWHVGGSLFARTAAMAHMAQRERMDDARILDCLD